MRVDTYKVLTTIPAETYTSHCSSEQTPGHLVLFVDFATVWYPLQSRGFHSDRRETEKVSGHLQLDRDRTH